MVFLLKLLKYGLDEWLEEGLHLKSNVINLLVTHLVGANSLAL